METNPTTQSAPPIADVASVSADDNNTPRHVVETICMRCRKNGTTTYFLTLIPRFRKILLSAFECPHCGERNNHVQFAGEIQPRGCHYMLDVPPGDKKMLNRQVVKSDTATIKIPELDFEIPPEAQRGSLSTVEGILIRAANELEALQEDRKQVYPRTAEAIDEFLIKLRACASATSQFTFVLNDPAGNSFVENQYAPSPDPSLTINIYERTPEQQANLGYLAKLPRREAGIMIKLLGASVASPRKEEPHTSVGASAGRRAIAQCDSAEIADALSRYSDPEEIMTFPTSCGACGTKCECRTYVTNIPYFKEVIVMASTCEGCGYRNSEVKQGGAISDKGKKITLQVNNVGDLSRDVIKSDTASVEIPELELEVASEVLGGVVTTVEGLISKIGESLGRVQGFTFGDDMDEGKRSKWEEFMAKINELKNMEKGWTLIVDDALSNSFVAPVTDDIKEDSLLTFEEYERSFEQNEDLGLNYTMDTSEAEADVAFLSVDVEQNV